jgi:hypothetical protein
MGSVMTAQKIRNYCLEETSVIGYGILRNVMVMGFALYFGMP